MVKKDAKKEEQVVEEVTAQATEELSEKDLLKQAEEREKARKEQEEAEKEATKAEEKEKKQEEKEERKAQRVTARKRPRHGKNYRKSAESIEKGKEYSLAEALELVLNSNPSKFDATVEMHVKLNVKEKNVRGMVTLPGGVIKEKKVREVTEENVEEVIADVKAGKIDFEVMIADIKVMPKLAQLAKVLGPKGLMPSPKAGTAVVDVKTAVEELRSGKVEYRVDKFNIIHMAIGRISFGAEKIQSNYQAIIDHLPKRIDSIYLTTTMGPSVKVVKK